MELIKELETALKSEELAGGHSAVLFVAGLLIGLAVGLSILLKHEKENKPINLN